MSNDNMVSCRNAWEQLPTEHLDQMLQEELRSVEIDEEAIRLILRILREREAEMPVEPSAKQLRAWEEYQTAVSDRGEAPKTRRSGNAWLPRVAMLLLTVGLVFALMPGEASAETLWERLMRWTGGIVEIFSPDTRNDNVYTAVFSTDHPGLRQVYDSAVELGFTAPVVPSWIPEGYELTECERMETSQKRGIRACFSDGSSQLVFTLERYDLDVSHSYHINSDDTLDYENSGIHHQIMRNNDLWVVLWFQDEIECSITLDCQEDTLYRILDSIYVMED